MITVTHVTRTLSMLISSTVLIMSVYAKDSTKAATPAVASEKTQTTVDATASATGNITASLTPEEIKFLDKYKSGFFATVENNKPRLRAWGLLKHENGKLYFCTSNEKPVFNQLKANDQAEFAVSDPDGNTLRVFGKTVFVDDKDLKKKTLDASPFLTKKYGGKNEYKFEIFYLEISEVFWDAMPPKPKK